jgi:predicted transcriptional regulator
MSTREEARKRTAKLKQLRLEHTETVERTQALVKEQKKIQRDICQSIRDTAKTVPEIAEEINMPTHEVLWYVTAFKKYDLVVEEGMCGEYVLYRRFEEKSK